MRKGIGMLAAVTLTMAPVAVSVALAPPAMACTGDPCDGFCITWDGLPPTVKHDVKLLSGPCPLR